MSFYNYMGNIYGNGGISPQNNMAGTNYQQPQINTQLANYGLKNYGMQFASQTEMEALIIPPSSQVVAFSKEGDVFYVKSADGLGRSTLKIFDFKERGSNENVLEVENHVKKEDLESFALKEDIIAINNKIEKLQNRLNNIKKQEA